MRWLARSSDARGCNQSYGTYLSVVGYVGGGDTKRTAADEVVRAGKKKEEKNWSLDAGPKSRLGRSETLSCMTLVSLAGRGLSAKANVP